MSYDTKKKYLASRPAVLPASQEEVVMYVNILPRLYLCLCITSSLSCIICLIKECNYSWVAIGPFLGRSIITDVDISLLKNKCLLIELVCIGNHCDKINSLLIFLKSYWKKSYPRWSLNKYKNLQNKDHYFFWKIQ